MQGNGRKPTDIELAQLIPPHVTGLNRRICEALVTDIFERPNPTADDFPAMNFAHDPRTRLVRIAYGRPLDVKPTIFLMRMADLKKLVGEILKFEAEAEANIGNPEVQAALNGVGTGLGITDIIRA